MMKRRGNCYVTCEALYHLLGGATSGWVPHTVRHEGGVHWFLAKQVKLGTYETWPGEYETHYSREILDPTRNQFKTQPPYGLGRGRGFLTKKPSKRARELMSKLLWQ